MKELKINDEGLTVTGLQVERYIQLIEREKELYRLKTEIASCAKVDTKEIDEKEKAYREEKRKIDDKFWNGTKMTEEEREKLFKLEKEWYEEMDRPKIIISRNKVDELILKYIGYGMKTTERRRYGFEDGAPAKSRVKIE